MVDEYIKFTNYYGSVSTASRKRTDQDWHLIPLNKLMVAPPSLKTSYINYENASGSYDLTDINGLNYANRTGKWQFKLMPSYDFDEIRFALIDWLHGGYFKIEISTETDGCYYLGRVMVDEWRSTERGDYITLSYIIEPFRVDPSKTLSQTITVSPDNPVTVNIPVTRKPVNPYIYVKALSGYLYIDYRRYATGGYANVTKTVTAKDISDAERRTTEIKVYKAVGGIGATTSTVPITFRVSSSGSATIDIKYTGGRL